MDDRILITTKDLGLMTIQDPAGGYYEAYVTRIYARTPRGNAYTDSKADERWLRAEPDPARSRMEYDEAMLEGFRAYLLGPVKGIPVTFFGSIEEMERSSEPKEVQEMRDICRKLDEEYPAGQIGSNIPKSS